MKKTLSLCFLLGQMAINAQEVNTCGSDYINQKLLQNNPALAAKMAAYELSLRQNKLTSKETDQVYQIPVVVHVMHKGEPVGVGSNVSDDLIKAKIRAINEEYRKVPGSRGDGPGVDMGIEFVLAVVDPSGNQTSGIVRKDLSGTSSYKNYGIKHYGTVGLAEASLKALSYWDSKVYYNIWIVSEIDNNDTTSGIHAWATFASSHGTATDGAVVLHTYFKDPNSKVETHELGHGLNLYHTFEGDGTGSTCPPTDPKQGDFCADTAPHKRTVTDCSAITNSCNTANPSDMEYLHNYMNYGYGICQNMFTPNQKERAVNALTTLRSSYLSATSTNKLIPNGAPMVDFFPNQSVVLSTNSYLQLSDASTGIPNNYIAGYNYPGMTFNWNVTDGTETLTSTEQNAKFQFTTPGIYNVSHDANNGFGSGSKNGNQLIYVLDPESELPANTTPSTTSGFYTVNYVKFNTIEKRTSAADNTPYSDFINTDKTLVIAGNTYLLEMNLYAGSTYKEYFGAYIDYNGDGIFSETEALGTSYIPANSTHPFSVPVVIDKNCVKNKLIRMRIVGNARDAITNDMVNGNTPFYIGDTKDFGLYVIDAPQSLGKEDYSLSNLSFYPNPVKDVFKISNNENIERIEIYNITGQLLMTENFQNTNIQMNISDLTTGTYIATVYSNGKKASIKVLKD